MKTNLNSNLGTPLPTFTVLAVALIIASGVRAATPKAPADRHARWAEHDSDRLATDLLTEAMPDPHRPAVEASMLLDDAFFGSSSGAKKGPNKGGPCKSWCAKNKKKAWTTKCKWEKCTGCSACSSGGARRSYPPTLRTGPTEGNSHCPSGFASPGLKRHTENNHGDICRNWQYSGVRSGANVAWSCPGSCVTSKLAPWCKKSASSSLPCRVPRSYLPKRCVHKEFYEVNYTPNWWDKSKCEDSLSRLWCRRCVKTLFHIKTAYECAREVMKEEWPMNGGSVIDHGFSILLSFAWDPSSKTCKANPMDEVGNGDWVYCVRRKSVFLTQRTVWGDGKRLARPTWITTQRCSASACVACSRAEEGCFVSGSGAKDKDQFEYALKVAADSDLRSSAITIMLQCVAGEKIDLIVRGKPKPTNGALATYFNGIRMNEYGGRGIEGIDGENEIMVKFTRQNISKKASAYVFVEVRNVRPDFAKCEDSKACLGAAGLASKWNTQQAKDLREFISLQYLCLKDEAELRAKYGGHTDVCRKWRECLKRSSRLEEIRETIEASGGSTAPLARGPCRSWCAKRKSAWMAKCKWKNCNGCSACSPNVSTRSSPASASHTSVRAVSPTACRNPYLTDPESWDCACHETMSEKCKIKDCGKGKDCFASCYRTQLCNDKKVCPEWKRKVCTKIMDCKTSDNDNALSSALKKMSKLSGAEETMSKSYTCKGLASNCRHEEIGVTVRHHCPWTCGMCHLYPYTSPVEPQADLEFDDAVAGKATARGWTLTPRMPMTHTPTDDQSCFVDPDAFDCNCYATKQRICRNEHARKLHHLRHPGTNGKVYSASECEHFFVCTHSQTCQPYKDKHCQKEMKLLKKLRAKNRKIRTC